MIMKPTEKKKPPLMRNAILLLGLLLLTFMAGRMTSPGGEHPHEDREPATATAPTAWTCSMHAQVRLPEAGKCPICLMDLIPTNSGGDEDLGPRTLAISENALALAEIMTAPVERRSVARKINMVGKIAFDETRVASITSWVAGRLDRLFVDYTGVTVRTNDHLVEIYSPVLYTAQQELLQAIRAEKQLGPDALEFLREASARTVISAREKLRLYGITLEQIEAIIEKGTPNERVTILAPMGGVVVHKEAVEGMYVKEGSHIYTIADLSKVWVFLNAYESDLAWLRYGQDVHFTVEAYPGEMFHGRVAFIDPVLDDRTRTIKVRLNVDNQEMRLKPDMFVSATADAVLTSHGKVVDKDLEGIWMCPMHPEITAPELLPCDECGMDLVPAEDLGFVADSSTGKSLVIPHTAPLITGKRAVVYVRLPDAAKPTFEGREVILGPRTGDWYIVRSGLLEGEQVVVQGNFKLDSELQIRAKFSMMNPDPNSAPPRIDLGVPGEYLQRLGASIDVYLRVQAAFAADQDNQSDAAALLSSLEQLDEGLLPEEAHKIWKERSLALMTAAKEFAEAPDLESRRVLLEPLTQALVPILEAFGYQREGGAVGIFHCPMALNDVGADWLQQEASTANPYYGSGMLRCGSRTKILEPGN
jgi:Cu(I)/Ag(I) efflux system membrane fusion protein